MAALPDFQALFEAMPSPCLVLDRDLCCVAVNATYLAVAGRRRENVVGRSILEVFPSADDGGAMLRASLRRVLATGRADAVASMPAPARAASASPARHWSLIHTPVLDSLGEVAFITQSVQDVTHNAHAEQQQRLLIAELNHRVKNALATVQSIAAQTLRSTSDVDAFRRAFEARLMALSATHDLLTASAWRGARLHDVIEREVMPYGAGRYELEGPEVDLSPSQALALGLLFHELTTNAVKYGALSNAEGRVRASWRIVPQPAGGRLEIVWSERDGPPVSPPARRGFGSRLIARALRDELAGDAGLVFDPGGVICRISLSLPGAVPAPMADAARV